jgi:predicted DCC family thiol-disulfide oxidoreductase YuxK
VFSLPGVVAVSPVERVVFFDGSCALCDATVQRLLDLDTAGRLRFSPLQGETAAASLPEPLRAGLTTVVYADESGRVRTHSDAALAILRTLGGGWATLAALCALVPRPIRDVVYRVVASTRYRVFGRVESCRMPREGEAERFLP